MAAAVNHAASRTNAPRHIIMFNIPFGRAAKNKDGARTFSNITLPRLERYAGLVGATLRVIRNRTEVSITPEVRSAWTRSPAGRGNSTIYVLKLLAVGQALQQLARNGGGAQARVLLIDDSVFITPNASDVFRVCHPEAAVCGFSEGHVARARDGNNLCPSASLAVGQRCPRARVDLLQHGRDRVRARRA